MRDGPSDQGQLLSPSHHASHGSGGMDQVFADFVADPIDDTGPRQEAVEDSEDGRHEDDEGETGGFIDDYLNHT